MVHPFINIASFYLGWFACLLGATHNMPWLGVLVMAALLALHLFLTANRTQELRFILVTGLLGTSLGFAAHAGRSVHLYESHPLMAVSHMDDGAVDGVCLNPQSLHALAARTLSPDLSLWRDWWATELLCRYGPGRAELCPFYHDHADGPCCRVEPRRSRPPAAGPHHVISGQPRRAVIASRR